MRSGRTTYSNVDETPAMIQVMHILIRIGFRFTRFANKKVVTRIGRQTWSAAIWKKNQIARYVPA